MNHPIEGSKKIDCKANFLVYYEYDKDVVKDKEGFTCGDYNKKAGREKVPEWVKEMQVNKIGKAELTENGTLILDNGKKIENFANYKDYKKAQKNRKTKYIDNIAR